MGSTHADSVLACPLRCRVLSRVAGQRRKATVAVVAVSLLLGSASAHAQGAFQLQEPESFGAGGRTTLRLLPEGGLVADSTPAAPLAPFLSVPPSLSGPPRAPPFAAMLYGGLVGFGAGRLSCGDTLGVAPWAIADLALLATAVVLSGGVGGPIAIAAWVVLGAGRVAEGADAAVLASRTRSLVDASGNSTEAGDSGPASPAGGWAFRFGG